MSEPPSGSTGNKSRDYGDTTSLDRLEISIQNDCDTINEMFKPCDQENHGTCIVDVGSGIPGAGNEVKHLIQNFQTSIDTGLESHGSATSHFKRPPPPPRHASSRARWNSVIDNNKKDPLGSQTPTTMSQKDTAGCSPSPSSNKPTQIPKLHVRRGSAPPPLAPQPPPKNPPKSYWRNLREEIVPPIPFAPPLPPKPGEAPPNYWRLLTEQLDASAPPPPPPLPPKPGEAPPDFWKNLMGTLYKKKDDIRKMHDGLQNDIKKGLNLRKTKKVSFPGEGNDGESATTEELIKRNASYLRGTMNHMSMLGDYYKGLYEEKKIVDAILFVNGTAFPAHRVPLSCHSKYFERVFIADENKDASYPIELDVRGTNPRLFSLFLSYVYSGTLPLAADQVGQFALMVEKLEAPHLEKFCKDFLANLYDQSLFVVSNGRNSRLFEECLGTVLKNFSSLVNHGDLWETDFDTIRLILSHDNISTESEVAIFNVALDWILHAPSKRVQFLPPIMSCVRFTLMTQKDLHSCLLGADTVRHCCDARQLIVEANWVISMHMLSLPDPLELKVDLRRNSTSNNKCETKKKTTVEPSEEGNDGYETEPEDLHFDAAAFDEVVFSDTSDEESPARRKDGDSTSKAKKRATPAHAACIADEKTQGKGKSGKESGRNSPNSNVWERYTNLPEPRQHHAVAIMNGKIYVIGGSDPKKHKTPTAVKNAHRFDVETKKWSEICSLHSPRIFHSVCSLYGMVYAIGGKDDKNRILETVECYNPIIDKWEFITSMFVGRFGAGAAKLGGKIFVAGGYGLPTDGDKPHQMLSHVECFSPRTNRWEEKSSLRLPRSYCNLVNVCAKLYVCGGLTMTGSTERGTASVDEYNSSSDVWDRLTDMEIGRYNAGATSLGTKLYIMGGISTASNRPLQSMECYDTETDAWDTNLTEIPYPAKWLSCLTLPSK